MEINIVWNICRVCLKEEQKKLLELANEEAMRHIFNDDKLLAKQIFDCTGIKMKLNDGLPEKICKKCLTMVKHAANLRKTCRASDIYLQNLLERTKSASSLFKPQWLPVEDMEDDLMSCNNNDDNDLKEQESLNSIKETETLKRKLSPLHKSPNKMCATKDTENNEIITVMEEENDLNNIVVEILENSENLTEDNQEKKPKILDLQDFHINNDTEYEETAESDIKYNNEQLYYVVKDEHSENTTPEEKHETNEEIQQQNLEIDDTEDENIQYVPDEEDENNIDKDEIDEEQLIHLEESNIEDNQAQVSSTVDTKDDQEEFIDNTDNEEEVDTKELQTEYIVDEYLVDDSHSSNISTRNSSVVLLNANKTSSGNRAKTILPERKTKSSGQNKVVASSSVGGMQVWVCDWCGNHFSNRQLLNIHMKIHRQEKKHECELCSKRFITACNLQAHMRIHTGEKPFECQYCGRRFNDRSSHLRHERIHTNEKPFQCSICQKAFSLTTTLSKHMKVHSSERSYRCDICSKSFKLQHQLKAHKNTTYHKAVESLGSMEN